MDSSLFPSFYLTKRMTDNIFLRGPRNRLIAPHLDLGDKKNPVKENDITCDIYGRMSVFIRYCRKDLGTGLQTMLTNKI